MNDLDDHLLRLDCCEYVLAYCLLLHVVAELLRYLVADVGIQQGATDVLHSFRDIDLGNLAFTLEDLERSLKSFTQIFKHMLYFILFRFHSGFYAK